MNKHRHITLWAALLKNGTQIKHKQLAKIWTLRNKADIETYIQKEVSDYIKKL